MATLASSSTFDEIKAEYKTAASYHESDDVALARRFVTAIRFLLLDLPKGLSSAPGSVSHNPELLQQELATALDFIKVGESQISRSGFTRGRAL